MSKILCFHLNQIGDLAFALPALKSIRDSRPDAKITSVVRPGLKEVLESTGLADEVVVRRGGLKWSKFKLAGYLRAQNFEMAVVFSQSAECALFAYLSRAPKRIGFINTSLGMLLTRRLEFYHPPSTENNLRLIEACSFNITARDYSGLLRSTQEQLSRANNLLAEQGIGLTDPIVAFSPGTSGRRSVKEWTDEGFAATGRFLISRGFRVVVLGTEPVDNIVKETPGIIDLSGRTNLGEVVAVLSRSKALVAVDSGILHLGAAVGTKVVGLYGPSNPAITGPQGQGHIVLTSGAECSPCVRTECERGRKCMIDLNASRVISAVESLL